MKPKVLCAVEGCQLPQHHAVHSPSEWQHDFVKPQVDKKRKPIAKHSPDMQNYYDDVRIPAVIAMQGALCDARLPGCSGYAVDIHEIVSRKEAGSLPKAVAYGTLNLCRKCHDTITTNPAMARERGFSKRLRDIE